MRNVRPRRVVGVSGAPGAPRAVEALRALRAARVETHLVVSGGGALTIPQETGLTLDQFCALADVCYDSRDVGAAIASGTFPTLGMLVIPCSMKTAAGICSGYSDNLLLRAADVTLKEGRPLVLCARESPLSAIHLRNLYELARMGVRIVPPMLTYYTGTCQAADMTRHIVGKCLDQFQIPYPSRTCWTGLTPEAEVENTL